MSYKILIIISAFILSSCTNLSKNQKVVNNNDENLYSFKLIEDSVSINKTAKAVIYLNKPYFSEKDTKIVVFLEADKNLPLKNDLSNASEIPRIAFHNLEYDIENQKRVYDNVVHRRASFIGKNFKTSGKNKFRGYILEYYKGDPLLDTLFDIKDTKMYFFEEEVFIVKD